MTAMDASARQGKPLRFANWEVRPQEGKLLVLGEPVKVGPRAFTLLLKLIEQSGRVVTRDELLACWPRKAVEDGNLSVQVSSLRKLIGDDAIMTIPGIGYRFCAVPEELPAPPVLPEPVAPAPAASAATGNLPPNIPVLIGRDGDVDELAALVRNRRVVSVVGAGGIGKTRLAGAVAQRLRHHFRDGAWLVELAPVSNPELLPVAVAQALGTRLPGKRPARDEVVEAMPGGALIVLDNCEHLVEAVSLFVQALLAHTGAHVLVTSQELLKFPEEHVYRLAPLSVPMEGDGMPIVDHGAVKLLAARIAAQKSDFKLDDSNAEDAAEVCRRLDGLPLAIELAAAAVPLVGLAGVRKRLSERLRLLTGGARTGLPRHRTLREALAWSHSLLGEGERAAFRRLGVFVGSFGMEQAEGVLSDMEGGEGCGEGALQLLGLLVDKSLVVVDGTDPPRYRLLESARAYALEMLQAAGETSRTSLRHAQVMIELFESPMARPWSLPSQQRLQFLLPDLGNVRAAIAWADHGDPTLHAALAGAAAWLFGASGQGVEGRRLCRGALLRTQPRMPASARARLHHELSVLLHDDPGMHKLRAARRAVALYRRLDDRAALYSALGRLAISAALCEQEEAAERAVQEMAGLWQPRWPRLARWDLLNARDFVANLAGRVDEGMALAEEQMKLAVAEGDTFKTLFAMLAREQCTATRGDYASAVAQGRELVAMARRERYAEKLHVYIDNLATALVMDGQVDQALEVAREAVVLDIRNESLWLALDMLAMLAFKRGRIAEAALIFGRADAANASWRSKDFREPVEGNVRDDLWAALKAALSADELERYLVQGAALSDEEAAELAVRG